MAEPVLSETERCWRDVMFQAGVRSDEQETQDAHHSSRSSPLPRFIRYAEDACRFSGETLVGHYAEVEVAPASAEARCGIIPRDAADAIVTASAHPVFDWVRLKA
ncbi:hypothetical protein [Teichococcus vastitatis]|uniref:Uncharacterized protein n=1 Tax=Teichococcus vastitatis TaxID=2307076 RepID=A0ABS9W6K9_9PROT|nr:hypothetical protein [Pseudoroseomonas vastitatis]MCI0754921.1 hypothetical protein [Pseudoroseomonas vastitatis]